MWGTGSFQGIKNRIIRGSLNRGLLGLRDEIDFERSQIDASYAERD